MPLSTASNLHTMTDRADRIVALDILRGFALLGMIIVHFHQGFRLTTPEYDAWPGEPLSEYVVWMGLEGKAAATYALLFGVGFAIILRRAEASGRPLTAFYLRRLLFLAAVGVAVEVLTGFVILYWLAVAGLWLLLFQRCRPRTLLALAAASVVAAPMYRFGQGIYEYLAGVEPDVPAASSAAAPEVGPPETYWQEVVSRFSSSAMDYLPAWDWLLPTGTVTLYLLGMAALRHGVFDQPRRHLRLVVGAMLFGLVSWALVWWVLPELPAGWFTWNRHGRALRSGFGILNQEWLAFTYIGAVVLLLTYAPRWHTRLAAVGVAGRLGFTNYVAQAAIVYWLKSEFGLGLALRPAWRLVAAFSLFAALALFSRVWLSRFQYGPLEWLWRVFSRWSLSANRSREAADRPPMIR